MSKAELLSTLFDDKTVRVLKNLINKKDIFYLRDLSRESKVSLATTYRIIQKCLEIHLVKKEIQGKFTLYKINRNSEAFQLLYEILIGRPEDILKDIKSKIAPAKLFFNKKDKSKFFVVGNNLNKAELEKKIKQETEKIALSPKILFLNSEQFNEMVQMGMLEDVC